MRLHTAVLTCALILVAGCAPAPTWQTADSPVAQAPVGDRAVPVGLEFIRIFANERSAPYFPIEGIGGVAFYGDGTLFFCDEKGGRIHGHDPNSDAWFQFDSPGGRFFRPVDIRLDQFSVLVLDMDGRDLLRYDLGGVFQDRLIDFTYLDPGYDRAPTAFDVDLDGSMIFADGGEDQILLIDSHLELTHTFGVHGSHPEQFREPSGVAYLRDGSFVVADRANRRLQHFTRLGYYERTIGGEFDRDNRLLTPQGLAVDADGNLFVADPAGGMIHVYSPGLDFLFTAGSDLGLLAAPTAPIDVAVGPNDQLAVTDRGRQAVLVYRIRYH
jgi:sugar lactone lactonase YvrE